MSGDQVNFEYEAGERMPRGQRVGWETSPAEEEWPRGVAESQSVVDCIYRAVFYLQAAISILLARFYKGTNSRFEKQEMV